MVIELSDVAVNTYIFDIKGKHNDDVYYMTFMFSIILILSSNSIYNERKIHIFFPMIIILNQWVFKVTKVSFPKYLVYFYSFNIIKEEKFPWEYFSNFSIQFQLRPNKLQFSKRKYSPLFSHLKLKLFLLPFAKQHKKIKGIQ